MFLRLKVRILSAFYIASRQPLMLLVMQLFQRINHRSDPILQLNAFLALSVLFLNELRFWGDVSEMRHGDQTRTLMNADDDRRSKRSKRSSRLKTIKGHRRFD